MKKKQLRQQLLNDVNRCASATECRSQRLHGQRRWGGSEPG